MNLIESPVLPEAPLMMGWAAPLAVHLLGLAIAATVALHLSRRWWVPFIRDFGGRPVGPGYSLGLALIALAVAYALEYVFILVINVPLAKWLLGSMYRSARVTDYLWLWLIHAARLLPYILAAVVVPRLSRPRAEGLRLGAGSGSWASVRPAFLTLVPWAVVLLLVFAFPHTSLVRASSFGGFLVPGVSIFLMNLLFMPFFLGVLTPALGRVLQPAVGLGAGSDGSPKPRLQAGLRLATLVLGVALTLAWACFLPRPGLAGAGVAAAGRPLLSYAYHGFIYLIAAVIQDRDRSVLWAPLATGVIALGVALVPFVLALFFQW